ncbi:GNAT family N-acetyltransferase [Salinithrix halophila]|uniref:GNAT family N-acetyltransferase n=1 Tax=Salinithrix halophila TaxID=1485204 RepID=A0ABV8JH29_9BACL
MKTKRVTTSSELEEVFRIRTTVFVEEQGVPLEEEIDAFEKEAVHVLAFYHEQAVGTGRLRIVEDTAKLERICVLDSYRQYGLGRAIVHALEEIAKEKGLTKVKLHGQTHAERFYSQLGYQKASDVFMEEGIPHRLMVKDLGQ